MNRKETYLESIRSALHAAMHEDDSVLVIGEDISDPYGGAFKVTKGLSSKYPNRVFNTPISESAIIGISTGLAIRKFKPVAEIMFGDFLALCADQILNSATKFGLMYEGKVNVPIVIRTPMGGGRGYGPTHSQSIEKMFFGIPGLRVISPSLAHNPGELLRHCIFQEEYPTIFVEYKNLYDKRLCNSEELDIKVCDQNKGYPVVVLENSPGKTPDIVILGYGGMSFDIIEILKEMKDEEINIRAIFPSLINTGLDKKIIEEFLTDCENIIISEMGTAGFNWGSEMLASIYESQVLKLDKPPIRVAAGNTVIPSSRKQEEEILPGVKQLRNTIMSMLI